MPEKPPFLASAARWTRYLIVAAIAIVLGLIVTTPRNEYPLTMSRAYAAGISAAPGYITTTLPATGGDHFFLIDTKNKVICVYSANGDKLRLVAGRKFDVDTDIVDASLVLKNIKIEGGNGVNYTDAKTFLDLLGPEIEKLLPKKKPK